MLVLRRQNILNPFGKLFPTAFYWCLALVPKGGSLEEVCKFGLTSDIGLLVNSSRGIIYASNGLDFAEQAAQNAKELQQKMNAILSHI